MISEKNAKILYDKDEKFLCVWNTEIESSEHWQNLIEEKASYDQEKTSIRLERAYCKVYQPESSYWNSKDFDVLVNELENKVNVLTSFLNIKKEKVHKLEKGTWGLVYEDQETCGPHGHGKTNHYAGTFYFKSDPGCGSIFFPEIGMEVFPESGDLLLFNSRLHHGVMPNTLPNAKRVCVAFNVIKEKRKDETV